MMQLVNRWMLLILLIFGVSHPSYATKLIEDSNWVQGQLDNGLRYHLYPTDDKEVSLRLVLHTGSLQESEEQKGYAHFVEHMAFNGSRNFSGNDIIKLVEKSGKQFGPDINAFTGYQRTVYQLELATQDDLNTALTWMRDVADGLNFDPEEVSKEKGVILGEFRFSRLETKDLFTHAYEYLIGNTVLADADPLGTILSVQEATAEGLRGYYQQWYQPHNAELVITGDVQVEALTPLLKQHFSSWASNGQAATTQQRLFKLNKSSNVFPIGENESPSLSYAIDRNASKPITTQKQLHQLWLDDISQALIQQRLTEALSESAVVVQSANMFTQWANYDRFSIGSVSFAPEQRETVETLLIATLRSLRDFGITPSELESVMASYKAADSNFDVNWDKQTPEFFAANRVAAIDSGEIVQGQQHQRASLHKFISFANLKRVNKNLANMLSSDLTWIIGRGPTEAEDVVRARLKQLPKQYAKRGVKPVEIDKGVPKLLQPNEAGKIVSRDDREANLTTWQLSNGIEVWFQQDPKAGKRAYINYASRGGRAALSPDLYAASNLLVDTALLSGLGELNGAKLDRFMRRKDVAIIPYLGLTFHGLEANTSVESLPLAFNAIYNIAEQIRLEQKQLDAVKRSVYHDNNVYFNSAEGQFYQAVNANTYLPNSRHRFLLNSDTASVTIEQMEQVHQTLFDYNRNNKMVIIANMEPEQVLPLIRKFIAPISLQAEPPVALNLDNGYNLQAKPSIDVPAATEKSVLLLKRVINDSPRPRTAQAVFADDMLQKISSIRLNDRIRESAGFDYAPEIFPVTQDGELAADWMVSTNIASQDIVAVNRELDKLLQELSLTITQEELDTAAKQLTNGLEPLNEDPLERSWFYTRYLIHGYGIDALLNIEQTAQSITLDYMQSRAKWAFGSDSRHMTATLTQQ